MRALRRDDAAFARARADAHRRVCVQFPGNEGGVGVHVSLLSRRAPPRLPWGFAPGERVFWTGRGEAAPNGERWTCVARASLFTTPDSYSSSS